MKFYDRVQMKKSIQLQTQLLQEHKYEEYEVEFDKHHKNEGAHC